MLALNKFESANTSKRIFGLSSALVNETECILSDRINNLSFTCPRVVDYNKDYLLTVSNIKDKTAIYKCIKSAYAEVLSYQKSNILDFNMYENKLLFTKLKIKPDIYFTSVNETDLKSLEDEHILIKHAFCPTIVNKEDVDYLYYIKHIKSNIRIQRAECINQRYNIEITDTKNVRVYNSFNKLTFIDTIDILYFNDVFWLIGCKKYRTNCNNYNGIGVWVSSNGLDFYPYLDTPIVVCYENDSIMYPFAELQGDLLVVYFSYYNNNTETTNVHRFKTDLHISEVLRWKNLKTKSLK